ncbi:MAG: hypothetical protein IJM27_12580 [Eubacterium sp.]|nr:hypothetical protein [Eubacterium sp.]
MQITEQLAEYARRNCRPMEYARAAVEDMKARAIYGTDSRNILYAAYPGLPRSELIAPGVSKLEVNGHKYHMKAEAGSVWFYHDGAVIEPRTGNGADGNAATARVEWMLRGFLEDDFRELQPGAQAVIATEVNGIISCTTARLDGEKMVFCFFNGESGTEYLVPQKNMEKYLSTIIAPETRVVNCPSRELAVQHAYVWYGKKKKGKGRMKVETGMLTIGRLKEEKENANVQLLAEVGSGGEIFYDGELKDIPEEYDSLEVVRNKWILGTGIIRIFCHYDQVAVIQNGVEHFRKRIREVLLLEGMQQELMKEVGIGEEQE